MYVTLIGKLHFLLRLKLHHPCPWRRRRASRVQNSPQEWVQFIDQDYIQAIANTLGDENLSESRMLLDRARLAGTIGEELPLSANSSN
jgi:hypothetical protein